MPSYRFSCDECSFEESLSMPISDYLDLKDNNVESSMCNNDCTYGKIILLSSVSCKVQKNREDVILDAKEGARSIVSKIKSGDLNAIENIYGNK